MWVIGYFAVLLFVRHERDVTIIPDVYTAILCAFALIMCIYLGPRRPKSNDLSTMDRDEEPKGL